MSAPGARAVAPFTFETLPSRVVFGPGTLARVPDELDRFGWRRALVLVTARGRDDGERLVRALGGRAVGLFAEARTHVPVEVASRARELAARLEADCTVALGGGSTVGLGKALSLDPGLPQLAVATTYAGSEMTSIWGITDGGIKHTGRDPRVLPRVVVYDPLLTLGLPARVTAASALNGIAHCVEALYSADANPMTSLGAEEGIRALVAGARRAVLAPDDIEARSLTLCGAYLAGCALGAVGMALHHKLCHVLGGTFDLPHAETHAAVLPHVVRFNQPAAPEAMARAARALSAPDAASALFALTAELGLPQRLTDLGLRPGDLPRAADLVTEKVYPNPRPITRQHILDLLTDALNGELRD
jgi:maleylacetate reductase